MKKNDLLNALEMSFPFVDKGHPIPQFASFYISTGFLSATDNYSGIQIPFDYEGDDFFVPADIFYKFVKKLTVEEVSLEYSKDVLVIRGKSMVGRIKNCFRKNKLSTIKFEEKEDLLKEVPENFISALKICKTNVEQDQSLGCLIGVIVVDKVMYGINRYSVMRVELKSSIENNIVLPMNVVNGLIGQEGKVSFYIEKKEDDSEEIFFITEKGIKIIGTLIDYALKQEMDVVLKEGSTGKKIDVGKLPSSICASIDRHCIVMGGTKDSDMRVVLKFDKNKLVMKGESSVGKIVERFKLEEEISVEEELSVCVSPFLLKKIMPYEPILSIDDDSLLLTFSGDDFKYFIFGEKL